MEAMFAKMTHMHYWLLKSEPQTYSIDDLKRERIGVWDGVRNYQARNNLRAMQKGDVCFFYHSSTAVPAIVGTATVVRTAYPDPSQFKRGGAYYEPRASEVQPVWDAIEVQFKKRFAEPINLAVLKNDPKLAGMPLLTPGSRLSVQPISKEHYARIIKMYGGSVRE